MGDLRDKIIKANDITTREVEVPEWGVSVWVRTLTAGERAQLARMVEEDGSVPDDYYAQIVACGARDESGERIFDESDIPTINEKSAAAVIRLANEIMAMGRFGESTRALAEKN